jgi:hypothetical protein
MKRAATAHITIEDCVLMAAVSTIPPPLNLTHQKLTGMLISPFKLRSAFSRGLGLLLVAFIFYGTTVDAAHRHGRVLPPGSDAASLTHSEQTPNPAGTGTGCNDCLICQLHQNLNTTLISYRLVNPPQRLHIRIPVILPRDVLSHAGSATAGRAPPVIS